MKKVLTILIIFFAINIFATHNRAGEITYKHLGGYKYRVTITTYTKIGGNVAADRDDLDIQWGDGYTNLVNRTAYTDYIIEASTGVGYRHNIYVGEHVYPGPGIYEIVMEDPNRNSNIQNIPESVNVVFTLKTILKISALVGNNSTPILLNKPLDFAAVGEVFLHNPGAYDPDGDSLSYKLTNCLGYTGVPIQGYSLPQAANSLTINEYTGDLVWDYPLDVGEYNIAILITEWRNGVAIGQILRDMQIDVKESSNSPPKIQQINDTCIVAGESLEFDVIATDLVDANLTLTASGMNHSLIGELGNPTFGNAETSPKYIKKTFKWTPNCNDINKHPYTVVFKADDNNNDVNLVDIKSIMITVVAPPPTIDTLLATNNSVNIQWTPSDCSNATGYYVYRKNSFFGYEPSHCQTGVPEYTGYKKIAMVESQNITSYLDNNNGLGLIQGYEYCYMVVAYYESGAESYASNEKCTELIKGIPIITNVSVKKTAIDTGEIYLAWVKAKEFDTILAPGPYKYLIYRSDDKWGQNFVLIDSLNNINDTIYFDSNLNTTDNIYSYKIEFFNDESNNRFLIGAPHLASSVYIKLFGDDNRLKIIFDNNTPWYNSKYTIFREHNLIFDSLITVQTDTFVDVNLANGIEYCYYVKSKGSYPSEGNENTIINLSQINCGEPIDTVASCPPTNTVTSMCDSMYNYLVWNNPNNDCADDIIQYNIYYSQTLNGELELLHINIGAEDTTFIHEPTVSIAGCYNITAVDSFYNESDLGVKVCIDNCEYYKLPNIFTPNGDNQNDVFRPATYKFIHKVDMTILNRWGNVLFTTDDPDILWDGRVDGKDVPDGVYYYICDVYEYRLEGIIPRNIKGFVHISRGDEIQKND